MPLAHVSPTRTKIVATLGPASESPEVVKRLIEAGADVFRLNFSHGDWNWHGTMVERIRGVSAELGCEVAILQDLCGPKIRLGEIAGGSRFCQLGETLRFVKEATGGPADLTLTYPSLVDDLAVGDVVYLADGAVSVRVVAKTDASAEVEVVMPGEIRSRQGLNLPGTRLRIASLTEKDLADLDWTARHPIDYVGLSFVRHPDDVSRLRAELARRGSQAHVVAKIEKPQAIEHLDAILERSDAVMVARGDLGVEIDVAQVPIVQKDVISRCQRRGVPVITATQMLESMRTSSRPTRAETTDVANAILDGTDAVMLSAETATGEYPVVAVETMNRIARATEGARLSWEVMRQATRAASGPPESAATAAQLTHALVTAAGRLADQIGARFIVAATEGGHTALALAKQRLATPILGLSDQVATARRMGLYWGVQAVHLTVPRTPTDFVAHVAEWVASHGLAVSGDRLVFVFGNHWAEGEYNALLVHQI